MDSTVADIKLTPRTSDTISQNDEEADIDSLKSFEIFRDFAVNYLPTRKPNSGVAILPEASDEVLQAMRTLKVGQPLEYEKFLTLIFVKLYSAHLECCHQSYEVRRQPPAGLNYERDPLVYEFNRLTKMFPEKKRIEMISSHIGYEYVKANPHLLDYEPIKKHVRIIEQVHQNIKEGVYWK